jgi:ABC-2 type transport system ATP-binding protein
MSAINCEALTHEFPEKNRSATARLALDGLSLSVDPGTVYGLLGPNGAGKTTTVKILTTLIIPTGGHASILGMDLLTESRKIRSRIGVAFGGDRGFYGRLTGRENLEYFAALTDLGPHDIKPGVDSILERMKLSERADSKVNTYSAGMRQRLHLARALVADPEVVFLDEPTVGLDPAVAHDLREEVKRLRRSGKTIFLTTHYMMEADELCDKIGVIFRGKIVVSGSPNEVKMGFDRMNVTECLVSSFDDAMLERLRASSLVADLEIADRSSFPCIKIFSGEQGDVSQYARQIFGSSIIGDIIVRQQTLEEAYLSIVRRQRF